MYYALSPEQEFYYREVLGIQSILKPVDHKKQNIAKAVIYQEKLNSEKKLLMEKMMQAFQWHTYEILSLKQVESLEVEEAFVFGSILLQKNLKKILCVASLEELLNSSQAKKLAWKKMQAYLKDMQ